MLSTWTRWLRGTMLRLFREKRDCILLSLLRHSSLMETMHIDTYTCMYSCLLTVLFTLLSVTKQLVDAQVCANAPVWNSSSSSSVQTLKNLHIWLDHGRNHWDEFIPCDPSFEAASHNISERHLHLTCDLPLILYLLIKCSRYYLHTYDSIGLFITLLSMSLPVDCSYLSKVDKTSPPYSYVPATYTNVSQHYVYHSMDTTQAK